MIRFIIILTLFILGACASESAKMAHQVNNNFKNEFISLPIRLSGKDDKNSQSYPLWDKNTNAFASHPPKFVDLIKELISESNAILNIISP